jgi:hypothetical protein
MVARTAAICQLFSYRDKKILDKMVFIPIIKAVSQPHIIKKGELT